MSNQIAGTGHTVARSLASTCRKYLTEDVSIGRPATEGRYRDDARKATSRDKADLALPPPETKRWSSRRKAAIVVAVQTGVMTREQARQRYLLSEEELAAWEVVFDRAGVRGLLVTRLQLYR